MKHALFRSRKSTLSILIVFFHNVLHRTRNISVVDCDHGINARVQVNIFSRPPAVLFFGRARQQHVSSAVILQSRPAAGKPMPPAWLPSEVD